ncbi:MAG: DUF1853 family protein [Motiliproteus sp.]
MSSTTRPISTSVVNINAKVRDLAWMLGSPPLCELTGTSDVDVWQSPHIRTWLEQLDQNPQPLLDFLEDHGKSAGHRLGVYFERLVWFFLQQNPAVETVIQGLRVEGEKRTLGEFDFLYRPFGTDTYTHLEVCIKFYLCMDGFSDANNWLGPNPTDRLSMKISKTTQRQLLLSGLPEAKALLTSLDIVIGRKKALFLGRLFYPWDDYCLDRFEYPASVAAGHNKGWWGSETRLASLIHDGERFQLLPKSGWLAPLSTQAAKPSEAAEIDVVRGKTPFMVARLRQQDNAWHEIDRGIVIPRHWPLLD